MPDRQPYRDFNFSVEIDGIGESQFSEVSIPEAEITVVEYREGADKTSATRKLPGRVRYGNVVLKRGVTGDLALWDWFRAIASGDFQPRNVTIALLDAERQPVVRWIARDAWPTKYAPSDLRAKGNEVVIELLELAVESIEVEATR
ncbi:MAG: phage tail protein [Gaiellaceae bacterium]